MQYRQQLILLIETYARARGVSPSRVSTVALNAGHTYQSLIDGKDITIGRFERGMVWFSTNWPEGVEWPAGIDRPPPDEKPTEEPQAPESDAAA